MRLAEADISPWRDCSRSSPTTGEKGGLFGNLALQRAHATGHAVWLYLPADGIKLRCNELIHMHLAPYKPNWTYFRADLTRKLWLEKIDLVQEVDSPDRGKVKSVTHIWTVDATMYDKGNGFDSADVVANGPGRLETRPDRGQAAERIAIWQDKLELQNELAPDGKIKQKIIVLTGKRPCIDDQCSFSVDRFGQVDQGVARAQDSTGSAGRQRGWRRLRYQTGARISRRPPARTGQDNDRSRMARRRFCSGGADTSRRR